MVVLRDGRKLLGIFRSYDQYGEFDELAGLRWVADRSTANFLLESTIERLHHRLEYADRDIGKISVTYGRDPD